MPTYRMTLEYEGTRYRGWQEQQNARSIAGAIRRAVEDTGERLLELGGSGRTDAGVHALGQVAHLRLAEEVLPEPYRIALNDRLPADIHVLALCEASERFHARHDARARSYLYQISLRRSAFAKRFVWWVRSPLDEGLLSEAAGAIPGRKDFASFCERPSEQTSTLVVVESCRVERHGDLLLVRLVASHFLWKMVRRLVGGLVRVGTGELSPAAWNDLLSGRVPRGEDGPARWTAPPSGLFLEAVLYEPDAVPPPLAPAVPVAALRPER